VADRGPIVFRRHASDRGALEAVDGYPSVRRLDFFTHGFLKAERRDGRLVLSDLRMGHEPDYVFRYAVAESDGQGGWREIAVQQLDWPLSGSLPLGWNLAANLEGTNPDWPQI
jgi:inner membrane protein